MGFVNVYIMLTFFIIIIFIVMVVVHSASYINTFQRKRRLYLDYPLVLYKISRVFYTSVLRLVHYDLCVVTSVCVRACVCVSGEAV